MKQIIAFNGSPRKNWNTAILLKKTLGGIKSVREDIEIETIHLYDVNYTGCKSCFACKRTGGKSYGQCILKDELTPILAKVKQADALLFGSPIYFGGVTGVMKAFLERLLFPYLTYTTPSSSLFPKKIPTAFIYTMNVTEEDIHKFHYDIPVLNIEKYLSLIFGSTGTLISFDTYQFPDYAKFFVPRFNAAEKIARRKTIFPKDCESAYEMGRGLARIMCTGIMFSPIWFDSRYLHKAPEHYLCPITHKLMDNPVVAADGYSYEREAIELLLGTACRMSPVTNRPFEHTVLIPNHSLKASISDFRSSLLIKPSLIVSSQAVRIQHRS